VTARRSIRSTTAVLLLAGTAAIGGGVAGGLAAEGDQPRCFGAAARAKPPCHNPRLRTMVTPTPAQAVAASNAPCTIIRTGRPLICRFGVETGEVEDTFALIGDSHATHWRGALQVVAERKRWRGLSMARLGCPLSTMVKALGEPIETLCRRWRRALYRWFEAHPEVSTVVVSQLAGFAEVHGGGDQFERQVRGFMAAWDKLPPSVKRIVVIRDNPRVLTSTRRCVERAMARRQAAGTKCSVPKRQVMIPDPAAVAAERTESERVHLIDMTRWFCGSRRCYPVIGGALTHKDTTHQTTVFNKTLGPYLKREFDRLGRG